jgi:DNA-binding transcriptional LysR family regulator
MADPLCLSPAILFRTVTGKLERSSFSRLPSKAPPSQKALPPFAALRAFDAVGRLGGIRKAAQVLNLDHAVVSRHLRAIEAWTGKSLINRSREGALLTGDGAHYHQQIAAAMDKISFATADLMKSGDIHSLTIWCMPSFAADWLIARFGAFEAANPTLEIELNTTNEIPDFAKHEADVDIRFIMHYGSNVAFPATVKTMKIAEPKTILVASQSYLARTPKIESAADILHHHLFHRVSHEAWRAWFAAQGLPDVKLLGTGPRLRHGHLMMDAARRGQGIGLVNELVAADEIAKGRLVRVESDAGFKSIALGAYFLAARTDRWNDKPVRRFREWVLKSISNAQQ